MQMQMQMQGPIQGSFASLEDDAILVAVEIKAKAIVAAGWEGEECLTVGRPGRWRAVHWWSSLIKEIYVSERTFSIIKPDAVKKGDAGAILAEIVKAGFKIVSIKKISISKAQAEGFYHVHSARPFFGELTEFMSSGPIVPMVLEKVNAIADLRKLMGATDPAKAEEGTIRKQFAASIGENAIHGSDAEDTAAFEIGYFFAGLELK